MKHYVCTGGCGGESSTPGVCREEGCKKEGEPLVPCDCPDGIHAGTRKETDKPESEED